MLHYENVHCGCDCGLSNGSSVTCQHTNLDRVPHFDAYMGSGVAFGILIWIGYHVWYNDTLGVGSIKGTLTCHICVFTLY